MTPDNVLEYWFGDLMNPRPRPGVWFEDAAKYDDNIRDQFGALLVEAHAGKLDYWAKTPRGRLALIILLDQFTRQIYRGTPRAFENDAKARKLAREALVLREDEKLHPVEQLFLLMPLEHSETAHDQEESVKRFEVLRQRMPEDFRVVADEFVDYARRHRDIIRRFGRFPHRNAMLGRISTPAETEFLRRPGSSF